MLWHHDGWLLPDMGTTGYGAKMHYDYYKNSATHNTLSVNQTNQPPANPQVSGWHMDSDALWLDSEVDWGKPPPELDSHSRVEWDATAWRDVRFRRRLLWLEEVLIDLSTVENRIASSSTGLCTWRRRRWIRAARRSPFRSADRCGIWPMQPWRR